VEEVDGGDEVADPAVRGARVHGHRAADGGGNADEALHPAQVQRGRLPDERGEAHPRPRHRLLAVELGATQAALQLEDHAANAAVADEEIVPPADHLDT
jgi:hypothetical protein